MFSIEELTSEQKEILQHPLDNDLYIEAPAGHGKTSTAVLLAGNIASTQLRKSEKQKILILTFSKMAVRQIENEKQELVYKQLHSKIIIKTYHSFYFNLIQQFAHYIGFRNKNIGLITESERKSLYSDFSFSNPGIDYLTFSYSQYLTSLINSPIPIETDTDHEKLLLASTYLLNYQKRENRIGFEDFPYFAYQILNNSSFIRNHLAYKFPFIFLDEFQNTNDLQWDILNIFTSKSRLVVFADFKQTIHSFRGAGNCLEKYKSCRNPVKYTLTNNFRNSSDLYNFANCIVQNKRLTSIPRCISFHKMTNYYQEKWNFKFDLLNFLKTNNQIKSLAILTKENKHVDELSNLFRQTKKTPFIRHEVVVNEFVDQNEENVILTILDLLSSKDLKKLPRLGYLLSACSTGTANYSYYLNQISENGLDSRISNTKGIPGIRNSKTIIDILINKDVLSTTDEQDVIWSKTKKILDEFSSISTLPSFNNSYARVKNIWDDIEGKKGPLIYEDFNDYIIVKRRKENFLENRSYRKGIFLMTIHQSQGKQFDAVFIWKCNDGIIPHKEEIENNVFLPSRNLLYVAVTRARHMVRFYYEDNQYNKPSRLIKPFL